MEFLLIVITNQSGVARGYFTEEEVRRFHEHMNMELSKLQGIRITDFYYSPYHIDGIIEKYKKRTNCRKPEADLFKRAIKDHDISVEDSIAIGDKYSDLKPALACGVPHAYLITQQAKCDIDDRSDIHIVKDWDVLLRDVLTKGSDITRRKS